ncbi:MAG TPA: ActS/PrrB/RegB family redox-sensitive histidine kinase [Xanthobacteraceae bacterium]|nr:ActS/PrrB/RegB family redox-sensitive histidine kinase [Xanthobacteraceae bacterium]
MSEDIASTFGRTGERRFGLRLDTLMRLRWLAVAGQTIALVTVHWGLGFTFPLAPALAIVAVTALTNLALRLRYTGAQRLGDEMAGALLAFDLIQLSLLLYLTGGIDNPFCVLFLAPVLVSTTALSRRTTLLLGGLAAGLVTLLAFFHYPLPWYPGEAIAPSALYRVSEWIALVLSLAFIGGYALRLAHETRQLSDALTATELVLAREQHLSALDGLAAAAAHELGTPLATIALVVRELERELPSGDSRAGDIKLLREQSERCRDILRRLTSLGSGDAPFDRMPLSHLLEEVVAPHRPFGIAIDIDLPAERGDEPVIARNPGLLYGLGNLVENAVDFASTGVTVSARWTEQEVTIAVTDDGPGFAPTVIGRIGEPYVTERSRSAGSGDPQAGLGLGFFIAKTLLERTGAALSLRNRAAPETGAVVQVSWPRRQFELNLNMTDRASPDSLATPSSDASLAPHHAAT